MRMVESTRSTMIPSNIGVVERLVRILAALLVVVLVAGAAIVFVRAQILKSAPSPIIAPTITNSTFSPNAYKSQRRQATLTVGLRDRDTATVVIFDMHDREVAKARMRQQGQRIRASWSGMLATGTMAPDGAYRFAIVLKQARRTIRIPDAITLDATAPIVESTAKAGQRIAPGLAGATGTYSFTLTANEPVRFRLDVRQVQADGTTRLRRRETKPVWTRSKDMHWSADAGNLPLDSVGEFVDPGSYIVGWHAEDRGGNILSAPSIVEPSRLAPAHVVGVETVALTPGLEPVTLLGDVTLIRHRPGRGFPGSTVARAKGAPGAVALPAATPGLYAIEITGGGWQGWAPEAVPGTTTIKLMMPIYSWQAANPSDADLSGFPDTPPAPLALDRPFTDLIEQQIAALARAGSAVRAELDRPLGAISDQAIEQRGVPRGTRLLVIAGAPVWTEELVSRLERFVSRGGQILILDTTSFSRQAERTGNAITIVGPARPDLTRVAPLSTLAEARTVVVAERPTPRVRY